MQHSIESIALKLGRRIYIDRALKAAADELYTVQGGGGGGGGTGRTFRIC